jgi:hypothetical protein
MSSAWCAVSTCGRTASHRRRSSAVTARASSASAAESWLPSSTASWGSTNSVAPDADSACTMPGTRPRASACTGITYRPLRTVTAASGDASCAASPRSAFSRAWISRARVSRTRRRARSTAASAPSHTRPSASNVCSRSRPMRGGGMGTARAAVRGARSSMRPSSARTRRMASKARPISIRASPSTTVPSGRSSSSSAVTSSMGSGRNGSPAASRPCSSVTVAREPRMAWRSVAGTRARTAAAPRGPTARLATSARVRANSSWSRTSPEASPGMPGGVPVRSVTCTPPRILLRQPTPSLPGRPRGSGHRMREAGVDRQARRSRRFLRRAAFSFRLRRSLGFS